MKINPINNPDIIKAYGKKQVAPVERRQVDSGVDEVTFSKDAISFSKALTEAREAMNQPLAASRQEKLDKIADDIRAGKYDVSSGDVADKMISDILDRYKP